MNNIRLTLLAAAAIGAGSIGSASAMPFSNVTAAPSESLVHDVRVVCDRYQRCWNTNARRTYRTVRPYYDDSYYYYNNRGYYSGPGYGYYSGPRVGIGIGPFGFGVW